MSKEQEALTEAVRLFKWFKQGMHPLESSQKWLAKYETLIDKEKIDGSSTVTR